MAKRTADIRVEGDRKLIKKLKTFPAKIQKRVMRPAVTKAATPVVKAARKFAPKGKGLKPDGSKREHLRKTITKTKAKVYKNGAVVVTLGPRFRAAPHAHLVDLGTQAHDITLTKPWGKVPAGTVIKHPGAKPVNYMKQAVETTGDAAQSAMEKAIAKGIEKEAAKLSKT